MATPPAGGSAWVTSGPRTLALDRWVAGFAAAGIVVCACVVGAALIGHRMIAGIGVLLIPGIPVLGVGQIWSILILKARTRRAPGSRTIWGSSGVRSGGNPWRLVSSLPKVVGPAILGLGFAGWLAAMSAFPALSQGNPSAGQAGCPWPLDNHGAITCVSQSTYLKARLAEQRLAGGVLLGFYSFHFGVAGGEVALRRREDQDH